jgi:hypothetical protein
MTSKSKPKDKPIRSCKLDIRLTEAERLEIFTTAAKCGLSPSDFVRKRALGFRPKARLTEAEAEAMAAFATARGDIMHFVNTLNGLSQKARLTLFKNEEYMLKWKKAVDNILIQWNKFIDVISK